MNDKVLTYILIGFVVLLVIALSIYFLPLIKKLIPKKKKKKKKAKSTAPKEEKIKRPILLSPQESKKSGDKPAELTFEKKEPEKPKTNDDFVMEFPPLVTAPKQNVGNRTVVNSRNIGNEFDEIKSYLQETEEDIFTSVGKKALFDSQNQNRNLKNFSTPAQTVNSSIDIINDYPDFVANSTKTTFNYSSPKEYNPKKSILDLQEDESDIIKQFKNLSPEMKKMLISDVLSRKKSDDF